MRTLIAVALAGLVGACGGACSPSAAPPAAPTPGTPVAQPAPAGPQAFSGLALWDDGLSEMSYYDAEATIYGKSRSYTRVQLLNRQWNSRSAGVKCEPDAADAAAVFKLHTAEEIPTENYNYRITSTCFLERPTLAPLKVAISTQEWCGATFKHLRWRDGSLQLKSFSYFPDEGDREWTLPGQTQCFEALYLLARDLVASGDASRSFSLMPPMRTNRQTAAEPFGATLQRSGEPTDLQTAAGTFRVQHVELRGSETHQAAFDVEASAPWKLVRYQTSEAGGLSGTLKFVERRAYWDRDKPSAFYEQGKAP